MTSMRVEQPHHHQCPGCQKPGIPNRMLACRPCWARLPREHKAAITAAGRHSRAHRDAVTAALNWYGDNQP